jgi:uncharacterized protein YjiS (DUF1127 family)/ketosteroid isomerase-like protein
MNSTHVSNNLSVIEEHIAREATDVDKAIELYTDDIVWESPLRNLIFRGKEAVANNYRRMFSSLKDIEIQPLERFATEHRVVDDAIVKFTLIGDGFINALAPIGTRVSLRLVHIFSMRDGKIERENVYENWSVGAEKRHKFAAKTFGVTAFLSQLTGALSSRCLDTLLVWQKRHRHRRELFCLLSFDDRTLADIGASRFWVEYEARKRFWQPPGPVAYPSAPSGSSREKGKYDDGPTRSVYGSCGSAPRNSCTL